MNWEVNLGNIIVLMVLGIVGYFLKDMRTSVKEKFSEHTQKIEVIKNDIHCLKEDLPQRFVMREDYLRGMSMVITKLDRLFTETSEIKERIAGIDRSPK